MAYEYFLNKYIEVILPSVINYCEDNSSNDIGETTLIELLTLIRNIIHNDKSVLDKIINSHLLKRLNPYFNLQMEASYGFLNQLMIFVHEISLTDKIEIMKVSSIH